RLLGHALLFVAALLASPTRVEACSQDMPVVHQLRFAGTNVIALADPIAGSVVKLGTAASVLTSHADFRFHAYAVFTPDGTSMIVARHDYSDELLAAGCFATFVHVERVDLATRTRTRIRRLRAAAASAMHLTDDGRRLVLDASDRDGEPVVHVFDLSTGERLRVTRDLRGEIVDDTTLFGTDLEGGHRLVELTTG